MNLLNPIPRSWRAGAALLLLVLAACGGGGGGDTGTPANNNDVPAAPTAVLASTQAEATALVRLAEQRTRDLRLASGLTAVPQAGLGRAFAAMAREPLARIQAVEDLSTDLCSSGKLSVTVADELVARFDADPNATMRAGDAIAVSSQACVIKAPLPLGEVSLGDFGVGALIDGAFSLVLEQRSGSNYLFSLTYTTFRYTPVGGTAFDPLDAVVRFGQQDGAPVYTLDLAGVRLLDAPSINAVGNTIAVESARLRAALAAGGHADLSYAGWTLDTVSQRASNGTVTVQGAGSTQALITASASGYTVDLSVAGASNRFSVAR